MIKLYSKEAERSLLGLIIKDSKQINHVVGILTDEDFYFKEHKIVFSVIKKVFEENKRIETITLVSYLESSKERTRDGWFEYIADLILDAGIPSSIKEYISHIKDKHQTRVLEGTLKESLDIVVREQKPISDLVQEIESKIFNITRDRELKDFLGISTLTKKYYEKLEYYKEVGHNDGIDIGIESLDNLIHGLQKGYFVIIASRPSMGKTAFSLEIIRSVAKKKKIGLFSIEMPSEQLIQRMVSTEALLDYSTIKNYTELTKEQNLRLENGLEKLKDLKLWIDDSPGIKIEELVWKIRKLNSLVDLDMVIIDYLQLIDSDLRGENRQQVVSEISRTLKALAREIEIPIIALSQLSRRVESREDKRPLMSDIRESGAIEQDADLIMFLYREAYYKKDEDQLKIQDIEVIISKHRNGPTGIVKLNFDIGYGKISSKPIERRRG